MPFVLTDFPEAFARPLRVSPLSAWLEHVPLAPILIKLLQPRSFVELGTHGGDSYLAFCQAVRALQTPTRCTAIDTWTGDAHSALYGPEILRDLQALHDPSYAAFSRLVPSTFDDAAPQFAPGSIDLLHIDGMHTYEAVKHDYDTWLPKLSPRGVILLHDTTEHQADFGVWKLWAEISQGRPHANLPYGHGLGIVCVGADTPPAFLEFLHALNADPNLVTALQALGAHVLLLRTTGNALRALLHCRLLVNQWRQRTGQPLPAIPDFPTALANPEAFGQAAAGDVHQLAQDALNLAEEVLRLRAAKP